MALLTKVGYGQVEPNHLSAQRTGQIFAQNKWTAGSDTELQNGSFLKYNGTTNGTGEFMLVYNEVKLYDKARQGYKDFALKVAEAVNGEIVPRLFKINENDVFTTNLVDITTKTAGTKLVPVVDGNVAILTEKAALELLQGDMVFEVVKMTTMPDGQEAVKVRFVGVHVPTVA